VKTLFGNKSHPYYLWAPRWVETSAGIRAIHYLCHALNQAGHKAYLVFAEPRHRGEPRVSADLLTPILDGEVLSAHLNAGLIPIAVYPEDVIGNPLGAPTVVRMLWNYSAALGGPNTFDNDEIIWAFSLNIAVDYFQKTGIRPEVLFVPPVNPTEFDSCSDKKPFQLVYAGKFRSFVGKPPQVGDLPTIEIYRDGNKKQPRALVKKLLSEASVVYSFENSSIVTEAILSGTPAGFVPNEFLGPVIAEQELGWGGTFMVGDEEGLRRAINSINEGQEAYRATVQQFPVQLQRFVEVTQFAAGGIGFSGAVILPDHQSSITRNRVHLGLNILRTKGLRIFLREVMRFVGRVFRRH